MTATSVQCPEALYWPETDTLRRCILAPHPDNPWHMAEGDVQWRPLSEAENSE